MHAGGKHTSADVGLGSNASHVVVRDDTLRLIELKVKAGSHFRRRRGRPVKRERIVMRLRYGPGGLPTMALLSSPAFHDTVVPSHWWRYAWKCFAQTRSGTSRSRLPVASKIALAMAPGMGD